MVLTEWSVFISQFSSSPCGSPLALSGPCPIPTSVSGGVICQRPLPCCSGDRPKLSPPPSCPVRSSWSSAASMVHVPDALQVPMPSPALVCPSPWAGALAHAQGFTLGLWLQQEARPWDCPCKYTCRGPQLVPPEQRVCRPSKATVSSLTTESTWAFPASNSIADTPQRLWGHRHAQDIMGSKTRLAPCRWLNSAAPLWVPRFPGGTMGALNIWGKQNILGMSHTSGKPSTRGDSEFPRPFLDHLVLGSPVLGVILGSKSHLRIYINRMRGCWCLSRVRKLCGHTRCRLPSARCVVTGEWNHSSFFLFIMFIISFKQL